MPRYDYSSGQGDDDASGDVVGEEEIMGAIQALMQQRGGRPAPARRARGPELAADKPRVQRLRAYLGVGSVTFDSSAKTSQKLIVEPQRAFRPERLVIARREDGDTAGLSCVLDNIFIGDQPQSPSQESPAPTEMFSPDATFSGIDFDVCDGGIKIQVNLSISALPTASDFVILTLGFYGDMLRGTSAQTSGR